MIRQQASTAKAQLVNLVDLVATALEQEQFQIAATEVTNEISQRFSCQRVSLGFLKRNRVSLEAISHSSQIEHHSNLVRTIEDAMSESLDQGSTVVYPESSDNNVLTTRFHARLSEVQQGASICTIPLVKNKKPVGSLVLERSPDNPFSQETMIQCEQVGLLIGPVLETRRRDERILPLKILESFQNGFTRLFGPGHLPLKVAGGMICGLILFLSIASGMFHVACDSLLEASIRRVVVAPQQGFLAKAHVRAGDLVKKGDLMATLDDQELRLEQRKWQSQNAQFLKKYRKALAHFNRAEVAIYNAQIAQAEAQLRLVEHQLSRTTLLAPFSGMVVKGDLTQALGSPVTKGEVLYEVAPTDKYRVVLKVDERDISLISIGQKGKLKLSGIPDRTINITIDRLTPVSLTEDGRNYFSVEAIMDDHSDLMRPGMEGVTKIDIKQKKLIWIWTRRMVDWLRLFIWSRLP
ncbi:MAG: HlyD family efflux transporter periplasmic adaptor subunit [Gammaproteobacteria bacterium]|nr:HlyD family efflux transporter periplasmic adaptor subunit [Gammaproteobacteria bacterium]